MMAECIFKKRKRRIVCTGSLRKEIELLERNLIPKTTPFNQNISIENEFTTLATVWAMNEDGGGQDVFSDVGIKIGQHTDNWYIRHLEGISSQTWVKFREDFYRILTVRDLERNRFYLKLECEFRGSSLKEATRA